MAYQNRPQGRWTKTLAGLKAANQIVAGRQFLQPTEDDDDNLPGSEEYSQDRAGGDQKKNRPRTSYRNPKYSSTNAQAGAPANSQAQGGVNTQTQSQLPTPPPQCTYCNLCITKWAIVQGHPWCQTHQWVRQADATTSHTCVYPCQPQPPPSSPNYSPQQTPVSQQYPNAPPHTAQQAWGQQPPLAQSYSPPMQPSFQQHPYNTSRPSPLAGQQPPLGQPYFPPTQSSSQQLPYNQSSPSPPAGQHPFYSPQQPSYSHYGPLGSYDQGQSQAYANPNPRSHTFSDPSRQEQYQNYGSSDGHLNYSSTW